MRTPLGRGAIIPAGEHRSGTRPQPAPSTPGQLLPQPAARQVRASVTAEASVELRRRHVCRSYRPPNETQPGLFGHRVRIP
jgi:hypothetical protein